MKKKKRKKIKIKKKNKKKSLGRRRKRKIKIRKKSLGIRRKSKIKIRKKRSLRKKSYKLKKYRKKSRKKIFLKIIRIQERIKLKLRFKINFNLDKAIKGFFEKIENKIHEYKTIGLEEKKRLKIEEFERQEREKQKLEEERKQELELQIKLKEKALKEEKKLEKERAKDLKIFLRKEQALLRKEQAERQRQFLEELKLEKQIEKFRVREIKELEKLEKFSLKEQREDYVGLQERIDKLKEKYRLIRDQKIRERVEALGIKTLDEDDRETLLRKEKEYTIARQKIETALESFYRSASSLVFQLNKRHITRHMSIFRCIDRRFENGEIFIKWDESSDDDWLILIYIKNNSPEEGIVVEDKSDPEKNISHEFKSSEIFKASDLMVDSLTQLLSRERSKNKID